MTRRQRLFVFAFAGLMAVAGIGAFTFILYRSIQTAAHPSSSGEDRALVVTAQAFVPFGARAVDPALESFTSRKTFDGTRTVEYTYSNKEGTSSGSQLYVSSTAQVFVQSLSTMQMFKMQQLAMKGGLSLVGDTETVPADHLLNLGDAHYAAVLKSKKSGATVGNLFMVRQGRAMLTVVVIGLSFEDPKAVEALLKPALDDARRRFVK